MKYATLLKNILLSTGIASLMMLFVSAESSSLAFSKYFVTAGGADPCWSCGDGGTHCTKSTGSENMPCGQCSDYCPGEDGEQCAYVDGASPVKCTTVSVSCTTGKHFICKNSICIYDSAVNCGERTGCSL
jgi:hypothetical protein